MVNVAAAHVEACGHLALRLHARSQSHTAHNVGFAHQHGQLLDCLHIHRFGAHLCAVHLIFAACRRNCHSVEGYRCLHQVNVELAGAQNVNLNHLGLKPHKRHFNFRLSGGQHQLVVAVNVGGGGQAVRPVVDNGSHNRLAGLAFAHRSFNLVELVTALFHQISNHFHVADHSLNQLVVINREPLRDENHNTLLENNVG